MEKKVNKTVTNRNWLRTASFFLLFALLSNMLYIPSYFYIKRITRDNALEYYNQKLTDGVRSLDMSLVALSNLQTMLSQDATYRITSYTNGTIDSTTLADMRNIVRAYLLPYDMVAETGLAMGDEILFTRNRIYYQRDLLSVETYFSASGMTTEEFTGRFDGAMSVLPAMVFDSVDYGSYEAFTVAWRWSRANDTYLFATFPVDTAFALMADTNTLSSCYISFQLGDTIIASNGTAPIKDFEQLTETAGTIGLTISLQIPNSFIELDLAKLRNLVQLFILIVGLATALWIVLLTVAAARPLNRITNALYNTSHLPKEPGAKVTVADLAEWIGKLDSRMTNYENIIAAQQENLRMHPLEKALYRGLYSQEDIEAFNQAFTNFPAHWQMAVLQFAPEESEMDAGGLMLLFTESIKREIPGAILLPTDSDTLLIILSAESENAAGPILEALRETMQKRYGILFSYALSDRYDDPTSLAGAYQQMEYESRVKLTVAAEPQLKKSVLSLQQLQGMYMALSCGDERVALGLLESSSAPILQQQDYFLSKHTYQMIANMLVVIRLESPCDLNDIPIPVFVRSDIDKLYEEDLPACFSAIARKISEQRQAMTQSLDQSIIRFISANLSNPMLCIGMVTEEFQISAPTLQKRLHASTGKTFSSYVEDARMSKARRELIETKRSVQEISEDCGYTTPNSFYKAYRRRYRETPLALRKNEKQ